MRHRFENNGQKFKKRCDFCHGAKFELYRAQFEEGGPQYWLCPGACIAKAQANYKVKRDKGIIPTQEQKDFGEPSELIRTSREGEDAIVG